MKQNLLLQNLGHLFHYSQNLGFSSYCPPDETKAITNGNIKAMGEWFAGISALEQLLLKITNLNPSIFQGLILSSPAPILSNEILINQIKTGIFTPEACQYFPSFPFQLPASLHCEANSPFPQITQLPLFPTDPLAQEQFSLIFTPYFGLLMVLGVNEQDQPQFYFSFDPELLGKAWEILRSRLVFTRHPQLSQLEEGISQLMPPIPDYRIVTEFTRYLLQFLPHSEPLAEKTIIESQTDTILKKNEVLSTSETSQKPEQHSDLELLQALTHEIRTPLTTIRTLTKLLLKRKDLNEKVLKHLEVIDQECSEQINRMELIFKAAEFKSKPSTNQKVSLTPISLEQVFQQSIPRWKKQAQRRNVLLDVILPKHLPTIVSDPAMLDQILTGLMEKFTRSAPIGGHIKVQISTAGNQLKLQMLSQSIYENNPLKSLGNLLMFQPETGSLTLNIDVTKNLFQALGGKLIVRQKPDFGEIFTIFLPLMNINSK